MSDSKKVKLEGDSKEPATKEQIEDKELEEVSGGLVPAVQPAPIADPPGVLVGRFSPTVSKY